MTLVPGLTGFFLLFSLEPGKLKTLIAACSSLLCLSGLMWTTYTIAFIKFFNNGKSPCMVRLIAWSAYLQLLSSLAVFVLCITCYVIDQEKIAAPITTFLLLASFFATLMGLAQNYPGAIN